MIGGMELVLILVFVVLLLFGAKKIPEFARSLGKAKAEFQRGQMLVEREIREEKNKFDAEDNKTQKRDKIVEAAKALGISTKGKSETEIKSEIAQKMA